MTEIKTFCKSALNFRTNSTRQKKETVISVSFLTLFYHSIYFHQGEQAQKLNMLLYSSSPTLPASNIYSIDFDLICFTATYLFVCTNVSVIEKCKIKKIIN